LPIQPRIAFVVSHTHWDREWYRTFHEFRAQLTRVVRQVLDALEGDEAFRHFLLDGQSIILEDHLAVHPEDAPRIRELARQGALSLGPWYVLPDEFLVSAESIVRNLLIGHEVASAHGRPQEVGYMPDSFGHIAQMPQILRGAGIDSFVYTRGSGDEIERVGHEHAWLAPDGSEVLAVNQCGGYCNAGGLGFHEIWHAHTRREVDLARAVDQVRGLFSKMARLSRSEIRLLNNGCDHFPPQRDLGRVLEALREAFPDTEFRHASLGEYLDALRSSGLEFESYEGELIGGRLHHVLSGVWSARMPLKQQNDRCQTWLADVLEPLCAYTHFVLGRDYPAGAIHDAWKRLLQNHPHDSICGCSTDEVHREMRPRFEGVRQTAEQLLRHELAHLAPTFARSAEDDDKTVLCVANPLPEPRVEVVERMVVLQPGRTRVADLRLYDEQGCPVAFEVVERLYVERFWGVDYRLELDAASQREKLGVYVDRLGHRILRGEEERDASDCHLTIRFVAELPPLGHVLFTLRDGGGGEAPGLLRTVEIADGVIENSFYRLSLHPDGSFDVEHKATGERYSGLNRLEDTEDIGDEYDYCPAAGSRTVTSEGARGSVQLLEQGGLRGRLQADLVLSLPEAIESGRGQRSDRLVDCPVTVRVGLSHDSPVIDVELDFHNRVQDHRLRAHFPTSIRTDTVVSDGHFLLNRRAVRRTGGDDWMQLPPPTWPQQEFSLIQDGSRGLAVLNRGLPEIEATPRPDGSVGLALTLLRAVGWLSRDDFPTRRHSNAGPTLHTPEAQCMGPHRFHYAVVPFAGDFIDAGVRGISRRYRTPPLCVQGVEDGAVPGGRGLLRTHSHKTCITAVKKHESRDSLVLRLYNLTAEQVDETLSLSAPICSKNACTS
jgi:alpha-mannosidase